MRNSLILAILAVAVLLAGCGGGSSSGSGSGPGPTPQPISVTFSVAPPSTIAAGGTANVSALVANDSAGKGVAWSCTPGTACGTFNPASTSSGAATTYTAPATAPTGGSVTITATSVSDSTKFAAGAVSFPISVDFGAVPPASLALSATASISAVITNDSANAGVTWSCMPSGSCGLFSLSSTASGTTTVYTAPATVPAGGSVTITATSVTDTTKSKSQTVSITPPVIAITLTTSPPGALMIATTAPIVATTVNDPATTPVNWSCTPMGSCGSFNPLATASGAATVYTAPSTPPTGGSVTITATSATDPTKTASATLHINGPASIATLKGQYAFFIQAPTGNRGTTTFVGSVNLDGKGNVLGGMEDVVATQRDDQGDPILPTVPGAIPNTSYYKVDASGHGTLRMLTQLGETLDLSFVLTSASHGQVIEADGNPGSGTLDLQTPTANGFAVSQLSGSYAFAMDGVNATTPATSTLALGGIFSSDGMGNITAGTIDVLTGGVVTMDSFTGNYPAPDANGRGRFSVVVQSPGTTRSFTFYIVSSKVLRLFENDGVDFTGGSAYAQGAAGNTLSGDFVYRHSGWSKPGRTVAAGQFAATTAGGITGGISDSNSGGTPTVPTKGVAVSGSYSIPSSAKGTMNLTDAAGSSTFNMYLVDPTVNILDPNNTMGGGGALLLHTDANITGTGVLLPQHVSATPTFTGTYALNLANSIATATPDELDLVGVLTGDASANFTNGLADYDQNSLFALPPMPMLGATMTGTFAPDATNAGHFTGTFSVTTPTSGYPFIPGAATPTTIAVSFYQASASQGFVIETDKLATIEGTLVQQLLP
jgi:hypothetical protein